MIEEGIIYAVSGKTLKSVVWVIVNSQPITGPHDRRIDTRVEDIWRTLMVEIGEDPDKPEEYADL